MRKIRESWRGMMGSWLSPPSSLLCLSSLAWSPPLVLSCSAWSTSRAAASGIEAWPTRSVAADVLLVQGKGSRLIRRDQLSLKRFSIFHQEEMVVLQQCEEGEEHWTGISKELTKASTTLLSGATTPRSPCCQATCTRPPPTTPSSRTAWPSPCQGWTLLRQPVLHH